MRRNFVANRKERRNENVQHKNTLVSGDYYEISGKEEKLCLHAKYPFFYDVFKLSIWYRAKLGRAPDTEKSS